MSSVFAMRRTATGLCLALVISAASTACLHVPAAVREQFEPQPPGRNHFAPGDQADAGPRDVHR